MTTSQSTSPDASDVAEAVEDHSESAARKARKEAQQLRARLRDAEAERDALAADIAGLRESTAALQRAEVERLASGRLSDPTDLWLTGVVLDDLLTDGADGARHLDPTKVAETVARVVDDHPGWVRSGPRPQLPPTWRSGASLRRDTYNSEPSWKGVIEKGAAGAVLPSVVRGRRHETPSDT